MLINLDIPSLDPEVREQETKPKTPKPFVPRGVKVRSDVELVKYGYTPGCLGCESAQRNGPARDHSRECRKRVEACMSLENKDAAAIVERSKRRKTLFAFVLCDM